MENNTQTEKINPTIATTENFFSTNNLLKQNKATPNVANVMVSLKIPEPQKKTVGINRHEMAIQR